MADELTATLSPRAEAILDTASALFYEYGIHAVGVDRIAAESGVTKRTLYDRFGSKEALALTYLRRREQRWRTLLAEHLDRHEPGPARVLAVFDAAKAMHPVAVSKGCSAINARAETPLDPTGDVLAEEVVAQKAWMRRRFAALCREAGLARPDTVARRLQLLLDGALASVGTRAVERPFDVARDLAATVLDAAGRRR